MQPKSLVPTTPSPRNFIMENITFTEHEHHSEMTTVTDTGISYDLENSDDYRGQLVAQQCEIQKLRFELKSALKSVEDCEPPLWTARILRKALGKTL